jgi:hypothetical protein
VHLSQKPEVIQEVTDSAKSLAAKTAVLLGPLVEVETQDDVYLSGAIKQQPGASEDELLLKLDRLFMEALNLTLDFRFRHNPAEFFWVRPNESFEAEIMSVDNVMETDNEAFQDGKVQVAVMPGVRYVDRGVEGQTGVLSRARIILQL